MWYPCCCRCVFWCPLTSSSKQRGGPGFSPSFWSNICFRRVLKASSFCLHGTHTAIFITLRTLGLYLMIRSRPHGSYLVVVSARHGDYFVVVPIRIQEFQNFWTAHRLNKIEDCCAKWIWPGKLKKLLPIQYSTEMSKADRQYHLPSPTVRIANNCPLRAEEFLQRLKTSEIF